MNSPTFLWGHSLHAFKQHFLGFVGLCKRVGIVCFDLSPCICVCSVHLLRNSVMLPSVGITMLTMCVAFINDMSNNLVIASSMSDRSWNSLFSCGLYVLMPFIQSRVNHPSSGGIPLGIGAPVHSIEHVLMYGCKLGCPASSVIMCSRRVILLARMSSLYLIVMPFASLSILPQ